MFPQETFLSAEGKSVQCWKPIDNHWLSLEAYPTEDAVVRKMQAMYPEGSRPDLYKQHSRAFGIADEEV